MKARVFTIRLDPSTGAFDDSELVTFFETHDAVFISQHAFTYAGAPLLAVVVHYRGEPKPTSRRPAAAPAPELTLNEADRALYETLRSWRNRLASKEGRPAYVLFTNQQLAEVARGRPKTLAALRAIDGIGDARVKGYGQPVLDLVNAVSPGATDDDPADRSG